MPRMDHALHAARLSHRRPPARSAASLLMLSVLTMSLALSAGCGNQSPPTSVELHAAMRRNESSPNIHDAMATFHGSKADEAVALFLAMAQSDDAAQSLRIYTMTDAEFSRFAERMPRQVAEQFSSVTIEESKAVRRLVRAVLNAGDAALQQGNADEAITHYNAVLAFAQANLSDDNIAMGQAIGRGAIKAAEERLASVPPSDHAPDHTNAP